MDVFTKQSSGVYDLVYNFTDQLLDGEIIKTHNVFLDGHLVEALAASGMYASGIVSQHEIYDFDTVIARVEMGEINSGYLITIYATTNRNNTYNHTIRLDIDDTDYPYSYYDFDYRFQTSERDRSIYILPRIGTGFTYNREYDITVRPGLSGYYNWGMDTTHSFWFTTQYCPLFATINTIKLMGGPVVESFSDDTIYRMIHKNSLEVVNMHNIGLGTSYGYDNWGCTPQNVPYHLRKYVECKTTYDLLVYADTIGHAGIAQTKHLGDMTIKYGGTSSSPGAAPDQKKELYDCFMGLAQQMGNGLQTAVRGYYNEDKGYLHPIRDVDHNRIIRTVDRVRSRPAGPWRKAVDYRWGDQSRSDL